MSRSLIARSLFTLALALSPVVPSALPAVAQSSATHTAQLAQDQVTLQNHLLTMDELTRVCKAASLATTSAKTDPALRWAFSPNNTDAQQTLAEMATSLRSSPMMLKILMLYGFTPETFSTASLSAVQTAVASAAVDSGVTSSSVASTLHVNSANIALFQSNKAAIDSLKKQYLTGS